MSHAYLKRMPVALLILGALTPCGCGSSREQPADRAERAVEQFLDAWSRGESPEAFANADQSITGTDPDWAKGYKLVSSMTVDRKPLPDQPDHIHCRVMLSVRDRSGNKLDREVTYDVLAGEKTVIRRVSP